MYSRYNPVSSEKFYPVEDEVYVPSDEDTVQVSQPVPPPEPPAHQTRDGGLMNGILDAFKTSSGKMDYGSIIILLLTVMLFLEESESETDLVIIAAALIILGF